MTADQAIAAADTIRSAPDRGPTLIYALEVIDALRAEVLRLREAASALVAGARPTWPAEQTSSSW
jgi:hypothetical protein